MALGISSWDVGDHLRTSMYVPPGDLFGRGGEPSGEARMAPIALRLSRRRLTRLTVLK